MGLKEETTETLEQLRINNYELRMFAGRRNLVDTIKFIIAFIIVYAAGLVVKTTGYFE